MSAKFHCGYVAILGRPNVGKSTLLNHLIGQKISITSRKPQTTRHRILGIKTLESAQILYIDTPGIHKKAHHALNRYMNRVATGAIAGVDVIVFMVDGLQWYEDDDLVLQKIETVDVPVILVVNKVDKIADKTALLPHLEMLNKKRQFAAVVPISAKRMADVTALEQVIVTYLPENPPAFPEDQVTDRTERFLVAEIIREKLMRHLGKELPYALTVEIEQYKETDKLLRIAAVIYVEKASQKRIVIGEDGNLLKAVGTEARLDLEKWLADKIFLQLWVKVKRGWSDDERSLQSLGYGT
jgi:GTP-binding protein Era